MNRRRSEPAYVNSATTLTYVARVSGEPSDVATRATRPQSLIITVYGAYSRAIGGWYSVASLRRLVADLGIEDAALRSSLSRFKRRGILTAERRNNVAGYALGEAARRTFDIGDERVLNRRIPPPNRGWVLVAFSIPESSRDVRYRLRSRLARVGLSQVTGGLWIGPRQLETDVRYVAERLNVEEYIDVFTAEHSAFRPTREAVQGWWDLREVSQMYEDFTHEYLDMANRWSRSKREPPGDRAFADYTRAMTSWRPLPYLDPGLPREYLPKNWAGDRATETFYAIHDQISLPALNYVREMCK